jgi:hypothetical protein
MHGYGESGADTSHVNCYGMAQYHNGGVDASAHDIIGYNELTNGGRVEPTDAQKMADILCLGGRCWVTKRVSFTMSAELNRHGLGIHTDLENKHRFTPNKSVIILGVLLVHLY